MKFGALVVATVSATAAVNGQIPGLDSLTCTKQTCGVELGTCVNDPICGGALVSIVPLLTPPLNISALQQYAPLLTTEQNVTDIVQCALCKCASDFDLDAQTLTVATTLVGGCGTSAPTSSAPAVGAGLLASVGALVARLW